VTNLEYLLKELREEREQREKAVIGQVKTYDEYAMLCGEIRGLTYAEDLIKATAKQLRQLEAEEEI
jgi:hypothetical protein